MSTRSILAVTLALRAAPAAAESAPPPVVAVSTPAELMAAIAAAQPGDEIVLADGTYRLGNVTCEAMGTAVQPIIVRAATPRGATIEMESSEGFRVTGAHWHFEDLDVRGVCAMDSTCEHAFHVTGAAEGFVLRGSRVRDFNAQLKVNASEIAGTYVIPHRGLVEYNEIGDTRARNTSNPVTKLNIDTGDDWIVRGNVLYDAQKNGGDNVSYLAFMKSGGNRGLFERNLAICSRNTTGGTRIGLSFGGGGTGAQFCAPAFDPDVPCEVEHRGGIMRNNIIASCSDVGIYLNRAADTKILFNTIIGTNGIDFRYATTTGEAAGNVLTSLIRTRDGGTVTASGNMAGVPVSQFQAWYMAPLAGDLRVIGDVSPLVGLGPARSDVLDDYCTIKRPAGMLTLGALEHSQATCETTMPPRGVPPVGDDHDAGIGGDDAPSTRGDGGGCCQTPRGLDGWTLLLVLAVLFRIAPIRGSGSRAARRSVGR